MFNPMNYLRGKISQWEAREKAERDRWKIRCPNCTMAVGPEGSFKLNEVWECRYCGHKVKE